MAQSVFSTGNLFGIPSGANPTPIRFATLQDVAVDFKFDLKKLYGGAQFPVEQARGKGEIDIKATAGRVDPNLFNQIFFGASIATGQTLNSVDETSAIPTTPFQITVANGATFSVDLGVYNATTGLYMTRGATATGAGVYAVNTTTGVYTFNTADVGSTVRISYTYTATTTTNATITQTNPLLGVGSIIFGLQLVNQTKVVVAGASVIKQFKLSFPAVQASKLNMPLKLDDFSLPTFDMSAQDDGAGNVFSWSITG